MQDNDNNTLNLRYQINYDEVKKSIDVVNNALKPMFEALIQSNESGSQCKLPESISGWTGNGAAIYNEKLATVRTGILTAYNVWTQFYQNVDNIVTNAKTADNYMANSFQDNRPGNYTIN